MERVVVDRLNLNLLRTLAVLLEQRNVTRAANTLRLTQSAISRQLAQLRDHFADPLLVREGNEFLLTVKAQQIKPGLQAILAQIENLRETRGFDPAACQRRFSFACTDYVANYIFPDVLTALQNEAAGIDVSFRIWQPDWLENLGGMPIDFAATMIDKVPDNLYGVHLGEDEPVLLMAEGHPLAAQPPSDVESLLAYPFARVTSGGEKDLFFDTELNRLHRQRRIAYEVPFYTSAFNVVARSEMLMILPQHIASNACSFYPLCWRTIPVERLPQHSYYLLWHSIHQHDSAHRWMRNKIAQVLHDSIFSPGGMN